MFIASDYIELRSVGAPCLHVNHEHVAPTER